MIGQRNRSTGWKHAKLSGHENEDRVKQLLDHGGASLLLNRVGCESDIIVQSSVGGLHEKRVAGVLGKKTKSKTDLKVFLGSGKQVNISIKKSLGGQIYFVRISTFFEVFETQFNKAIPPNVKRAMELFWAGADDAPAIIEQWGDKGQKKSYDLQLRHRSLNAETLKRYNYELYESMLQWFQENIYELSKLSFAMGAVANEQEWSTFVWYKNMLGEHKVDDLFYIEDIAKQSVREAHTQICYGHENGGTTIQLPFGFVQWHQKKMQFHHNYWKVLALCASKVHERKTQ